MTQENKDKHTSPPHSVPTRLDARTFEVNCQNHHGIDLAHSLRNALPPNTPSTNEFKAAGYMHIPTYNKREYDFWYQEEDLSGKKRSIPKLREQYIEWYVLNFHTG